MYDCALGVFIPESALLAGFFFSLAPDAVQAASLKLAWDASPESDISGYGVAYRSEDGSHRGMVMVGRSTEATVSRLRSGIRYTLFMCRLQQCRFVERAVSGSIWRGHRGGRRSGADSWSRQRHPHVFRGRRRGPLLVSPRLTEHHQHRNRRGRSRSCVKAERPCSASTTCRR